jgi:hypothetical protein
MSVCLCVLLLVVLFSLSGTQLTLSRYLCVSLFVVSVSLCICLCVSLFVFVCVLQLFSNVLREEIDSEAAARKLQGRLSYSEHYTYVLFCFVFFSSSSFFSGVYTARCWRDSLESLFPVAVMFVRCANLTARRFCVTTTALL